MNQIVAYIAEKIKNTRPRQHKKMKDVPAWIRKPIYEELLALKEEEKKMQEALDLCCAPRLSVVDEQNVVMLLPKDRDKHNLDKVMKKAIEERVKEKEKERVEAQQNQENIRTEK